MIFKTNPFILCIIVICILGCNNKERYVREAHNLAKRKCSACHEFVEAEVLDRGTWMLSILPEMTLRAKLNLEERIQIENYYNLVAPDALTPAVSSAKIVRDNWLFEPLQPKKKISGLATTTLVKTDAATGIIYTSDANQGALFRWNSNLEPIDTTPMTYGVSSALFLKDENNQQKAVFTVIGHLNPNDGAHGSVLEYNLGKKLKLTDTIATDLPRPVATAEADFNNDGLTDYLTCGFGHETGGLFISWQQPGKTFNKQELVSTSGPAQLHIGDFNKDGWQDFMVLFGNAEESIRLFTNNKNGSFTEKRLLNFLPVAGSTSFQVVDMNKDGLPDIIYTCGDNADLSKILKPFHGLYIYINQGDFKYEQKYFYPINGCTKAIAADFDNDGDIDIATIAFFADFNNNPAEKFILFEEDSPMHFIPHSPNIETMGRWLCMDVADYDNDGDLDIIIGNFSQGFINFPVLKNRWDGRHPFVVMKNNLHHL
ncbi:MAG: VCBS repeat-containing protein [Chitinophagaceae bacterium]|nr:VCBS repeat-containing protein [Chitinophagaceae bacterium]